MHALYSMCSKLQSDNLGQTMFFEFSEVFDCVSRTSPNTEWLTGS